MHGQWQQCSGIMHCVAHWTAVGGLIRSGKVPGQLPDAVKNEMVEIPICA